MGPVKVLMKAMVLQLMCYDVSVASDDEPSPILCRIDVELVTFFWLVWMRQSVDNDGSVSQNVYSCNLITYVGDDWGKMGCFCDVR